LAWATAATITTSRARAFCPGKPTRTELEASTNSVQRIGTSLSNSLVMSRSRRAEAFQAIILGGSPGK